MSAKSLEIAQTSIRQLKIGSFVRLQIEDAGQSSVLLRIGREPAMNLTKKQKDDLAILLAMDAQVLDAARLLEARIIHGSPAMKQTLANLLTGEPGNEML